MSILDNITGGISDVAQLAEQAASTLVGGPAGAVVGPLMGNLLQGPTQSLFSQLPQAFSSLFSNAQSGQQLSFQATPLPFSTQAAGINPSFLQNPSALFNALGSVVSKGQSQGQSIGGLLNNLDTGGIDSQVTNLMNSAQQAAQNGDAMTAQKDMIQAQTLFQTISQLMNQIGSMQKEALQNSKLN